METIRIRAERQYRSRSYTGPGPEWKYAYLLPSRQVTAKDGRTVTVTPGGFTTKSETVALVRRLYDVRPLAVEFPDGTVTTVKR